MPILLLIIVILILLYLILELLIALVKIIGVLIGALIAIVVAGFLIYYVFKGLWHLGKFLFYAAVPFFEDTIKPACSSFRSFTAQFLIKAHRKLRELYEGKPKQPVYVPKPRKSGEVHIWKD